ncbi:MAG: substrate-binding domain-containing protein [Brasilonema angustatum HA4187-MV1]|jgi:ABC-type molybdate transport system substrate-binding protein|nr:substrate-binding domain-containing protein [Brasilonema angustatum HA4187-MV1]
MKKYLLAVSLITCAFNVCLTNQSLALTLTNSSQSQPPTLTLYAAGSLRGALSEVANVFTQQYGIPVKTEFASSGSLRERLENGEQADVFASADTGNAIALNQKNLSGQVLIFASNPLYAIARVTPRGLSFRQPSPRIEDSGQFGSAGLGRRAGEAIASPRVSLTTDNLLDQFLNPDVKLGIAQPGRDPLGDYAIEIFRKADQIRPGSFEQLNAKAIRFTGSLPPERNSPGGSIVYYLEEAQQADIYPVYYTSALAALELSPNLQLVKLPDNLAVKGDYGLTVLKNASPNGAKLAEYILLPAGQQILAKYGFSSPSSTHSTSVPESHNLGGIILAVGIGLVLKKTSASSKKRTLRKVATYCH